MKILINLVTGIVVIGVSLFAGLRVMKSLSTDIYKTTFNITPVELIHVIPGGLSTDSILVGSLLVALVLVGSLFILFLKNSNTGIYVDEDEVTQISEVTDSVSKNKHWYVQRVEQRFGKTRSILNNDQKEQRKSEDEKIEAEPKRKGWFSMKKRY